MDDRRKLASAVWDCTVGAGNAAEDPAHDDLIYIEERLGRRLTLADLEQVRREWARCLRDMAQP